MYRCLRCPPSNRKDHQCETIGHHNNNSAISRAFILKGHISPDRPITKTHAFKIGIFHHRIRIVVFHARETSVYSLNGCQALFNSFLSATVKFPPSFLNNGGIVETPTAHLHESTRFPILHSVSHFPCTGNSKMIKSINLCGTTLN